MNKNLKYFDLVWLSTIMDLASSITDRKICATSYYENRACGKYICFVSILSLNILKTFERPFKAATECAKKIQN